MSIRDGVEPSRSPDSRTHTPPPSRHSSRAAAPDHPAAPPPPGSGSPGSRRPARWLAAVVAGVVLLASGYGISQALDRDNAAPAGAGIPTAAPVAAAPVPSASGEEPAAAVAKALLPTVVEISHGSGLGSGFVYDTSGYIMTAAHVVQGTSEVNVRLYDGTK